MNRVHFATLGAAVLVVSSVSVASAQSSKEFLTDAI